MNLQKLQRVVIDALEDVKAQDIKVFDTTGVTSLFDRVVIASGTSNRQTRALADRVRERVKEAGGDVLSVEGEDTGEWVLVDLADIVVHVMQPAIRQYYNLEEIWGEKPVRARLAAATPLSVVSTTSPDPAEAAKPPRRRAAVRKADAASEAKPAPAKPTAVRRSTARKAPAAVAVEAHAAAAHEAGSDEATQTAAPRSRTTTRARVGARRAAS